MKKIIFTIISILCLIGVANAKEYCTVVSGDGNHIGDEIACGTEHFYVIENDGSNIKMLAKYNLYVGSIYNKIKLDITKTYVKAACQEDPYTSDGYYCSEYFADSEFYYEGNKLNSIYDWQSRIKEQYNIDGLVYMNEATYYENHSYYNGNKALFVKEYGERYTIDGKLYQNLTYKLYPYTYINEGTEGYALQNELARGVTGEKGNANYPIYGSTILIAGFDTNGHYSVDNIDILNNFANGYTNFSFKNNTFTKKYLDDYKTKLNDYNISNVDLLSIEELNNLVYSISNKNLPLEEWYNQSKDSSIDEEAGTEYYTLGDLKEYLSDDYSWLWYTTYWTKTLALNPADISYDDISRNAYFISSKGDICYSNAICYEGIPRAGIRPVVTISKNDLLYTIKTRTDGNGTVKAEKVSALGEEVIKFTVEPNEGYVLGEVKVTDANGNVVTFTDNTFTMPYANVLIEATFVKTNPETSDIAIATLILLALATLTITILNYKKIKEVN